MVNHFIFFFSILAISCFSVQINSPKEPETEIAESEIIPTSSNNTIEDIYEFSDDEVKKMLLRINKIRKKGCRCDGKYLRPVKQLKWSKLLYISAYKHAKSMHENDYFSHYSPDGKDIGDRLDMIGYKWQYAGENLAEGQKTFEEAMHDWIASPTHCNMLMNPNMEEVAVARYGNYWVQHFGKKMPKNARRINERYTDGSR